MMIDQFHLVNLPFQELHSKFPRNLNTIMRIRLVGQGRILTHRLQSHLVGLLIDLTTNGIDLDVLTTDLLGIFIHRLRHHLDGVSIESATEGRVR